MSKKALYRVAGISAVVLASAFMLFAIGSYSTMPMTSTSYIIPSYDINGVGTAKSSTDYRLYDSGAQSTPVGASTGGSYIMQSGYTYTISDISTKDINPPLVQLFQPNGGQAWKGGDTYSVSWMAIDDVTPSQNISIEGYYSVNSAAGPWIMFTATNESASGVGTYEWTLPMVSSSTVMVKIQAKDAAGNVGIAESATNFSIDSTGPVINILRPKNPGFAALNRQLDVKWTAVDAINSVQPNSISIFYSLDNGASWVLAATNEANTGYFAWSVPNQLTDQALISIEAIDTLGWIGYGLNHFSIITDESAPTVTVESPAGGEIINVGTNYQITWESDDNVEVIGHYIYVNSNGGVGGWTQVTPTPLSGEAQSYTWAIPLTTPRSANYVLSVEAYDISGNIGWAISKPFTLSATDTSVPYGVSVESPIGGEKWNAGSTYTIAWQGYDATDLSNTLKGRLYYSTNSGSTWNFITGEITEDSSGEGRYSWTIPTGTNSTTCMVKVEVYNPVGTTTSGESKNVFTITSKNYGNKTFIMSYNSNNENNYCDVPFQGSDTSLNQLALDIGASWETSGSLAQWDGLMLECYDNSLKTLKGYVSYGYDPGSGGWQMIDSNGSSDLIQGNVVIAHVQPGAYGGTVRNVTYNWFTSGIIPDPGQVTYVLCYNNNNEINYASLPFSSTVTTLGGVAQAIGASWEASGKLQNWDGLMLELYDNSLKTLKGYVSYGFDSSWQAIDSNGTSNIDKGDVVITHVQPGAYGGTVRSVTFNW